MDGQTEFKLRTVFTVITAPGCSNIGRDCLRFLITHRATHAHDYTDRGVPAKKVYHVHTGKSTVFPLKATTTCPTVILGAAELTDCQMQYHLHEHVLKQTACTHSEVGFGYMVEIIDFITKDMF